MPDYSLGRFLVFTRAVHRSGVLVEGELPLAISHNDLQTAMTAAASVLGVAPWVRVFDCHLGQDVPIVDAGPSSSYFASSYFASAYFAGLAG